MLGNFLPCTKANPKQHAIAVVLGLVIVYGIASGVALRTIEGLFTQLELAGVHLGEKYPDKALLRGLGALPGNCVVKSLAPGFGMPPSIFNIQAHGGL